MKYLFFMACSVGMALVILLLSLWRQGQATIFPQAPMAAPSTAPNSVSVAMPKELLDALVVYRPRILPLQPWYLPKMLWQRFELAIPRTKSDQQALLLARSHERMLIGLYLWQKNSLQNAQANILKSQQYLLQAAQIDTNPGYERVRELQTQHKTFLDHLPAQSQLLSQAAAINAHIQLLVW